jgi:hypothetical protein
LVVLPQQLSAWKAAAPKYATNRIIELAQGLFKIFL